MLYDTIASNFFANGIEYPRHLPNKVSLSSLTPRTTAHDPHIYGTIHLNRWMAAHICEHNHPVFASIYLKTCVTNYAHSIAQVGPTYVSSGENHFDRGDSWGSTPFSPLRQWRCSRLGLKEV